MTYEGLLTSLGNLPQSLSWKYRWLWGDQTDALQEVHMAVWKGFQAYGELEDEAVRAKVLATVYNHIRSSYYQYMLRKNLLEADTLETWREPTYVMSVDERIYFSEFIQHLMEMLTKVDKVVLIAMLEQGYHREAYATHLRKQAVGAPTDQVRPTVRALAKAVGMGSASCSIHLANIIRKAEEKREALKSS